MATPSRGNPPSSARRVSYSGSPTVSATLARGATARSAASSRPPTLNSAPIRRPVSKNAVPTPTINGEIHDALSASLKQETDHKEQLLVQLQDKEQLISTYVTENNNLTSSLTDAENRLNELYAEQSRWEAELAQRIDISEKLREQVRELEKEKRDIQRRYNEQTATFEAERQAFYDNEQHLKSRIQSLSQTRRRIETVHPQIEPESDVETIDDKFPPSPDSSHIDNDVGQQDSGLDDPSDEPAEMTSLKLELSTLSTSYSSLQSTLILMQTQLVDLKRVNQELQEENESYMILLREKTLSGQFDLLKQVGGQSRSDDDDEASTDASSMHSLPRSTLGRVEEEPGDESFGSGLSDDTSDIHDSRQHVKVERKRTISSHAPRGESLADLPITGPGLDLAAELGRAENKDILAGNTLEDRDRLGTFGKVKRNKKTLDTKGSHFESAGGDSSADIDALRTEVKSLKDANKALSLYASKIIDRIIAQEGFEHVLAADYEKEPATPLTATPNPNTSGLPFSQSRPRPQSINFGRSTSNPSATSPPPLSRPDPKAKRRSLSFDWTSFSLFSNDKKSEPSPSLRPLTLKPGSVPVTGGRKLDNLEDEEDRKERERIHATMKLMGIQPPAHSPINSPIAPAIERAPETAKPPAKNNHRFSFFGSKTAGENRDKDSSSIHSLSSSFQQFDRSTGLTEEALEHAEAENSLAVLDARERDLSVEIAKGSASGFTEIAPRASRRNRRSAGGSSGSTVWSAGMSGNDD